jgi:hypothetical protein
LTRFCGYSTQFSCDKEHGDQGQRIEQCRVWAASN